MKVIILAAGRGSRLGVLTRNKPKCLNIFQGAPLIESCLSVLSQFFSEDQIYIVGGYKYKLLKKYSKNIIVNKNWSKTNIVGSLKFADMILNSENCLVVYSDIFFEPEAVRLMVQTDSFSVLNLTNWFGIWEKRFSDPLLDAENFITEKTSNLVVKIGGKTDKIESINGQFGGMYTLTPEIWSQIKSFKDFNLNQSDTTSMLQRAIDEGIALESVNYNGYWAEIDSLTDIASQEK